uniref:Uncharacterized protein n=1 Tax=Marmota marmota marmota TaxID=9994 RepID=A0A8C5ZX19_MARMA
MTTSLEAEGATGFQGATGSRRLPRRLPTRAFLSLLVFRRRTRPGFSGCWKG